MPHLKLNLVYYHNSSHYYYRIALQHLSEEILLYSHQIICIYVFISVKTYMMEWIVDMTFSY